MSQFNTPILLISFNNLSTTARVFEVIKKIKPKKLFFAVDAPRENFLEEIEKCNAVKNLVSKIDWDCELKTFFPENNLNARLAVSSAISWFFKDCSEGIILEHDCLPDESFFKFCEELLERYRDDERVMHIGGNCFIPDNLKNSNDSFYLSSVPHIWGWATWSRAWKYYNLEMKSFPDFLKQKQINNIFSKKIERSFWNNVFYRNYQRLDNTWDFQWTYAVFSQGGICLNPCKNLVSNIGFLPDALNTKDCNHKFANLKLENIRFPLVYPEFFIKNKRIDSFINRNNFDISINNYLIKNLLRNLGLFNLIKNIYLKLKK